MLKVPVTLLRGRSTDAAEAFTDVHALPLLHQQLRNCAAGVDAARRPVAMVMAHATRERNSAERIAGQLADLETRALAALSQGREDLATEAAGAIAQLEAERDTTARTIATYDNEIVQLRGALSEAETRLRDLAPLATASLADAEVTLNRRLSTPRILVMNEGLPGGRSRAFLAAVVSDREKMPVG